MGGSLEVLDQLITDCGRREDTNVCKQLADELGRGIVNDFAFHFFHFRIVFKDRKHVTLLEREPLQELERLSKDVEGFIILLGAQSNGESADPVDNATVLEDCFSSYEHTVNVTNAKTDR